MPPRSRRARSNTREASTSRRRRRSPTPSPPPTPLPWALSTADQRNHYKMLKKRTLVPSKFFDPFTIHHLGLRGEVTALLENIGWVHFASLQRPTYKEVTYEILSTFHTDYNPYDQRDRRCINSQCMGEPRHLSLRELNNIFGFPPEGITFNVPEFSPHEAWTQLTGQQDYNPCQSKSTFIRNHALRYVHRVMALSLFGRGCSTGVVSKVELLFLWAMSNHVQINTGAWLVKHIWHVARSKAGRICIGGLLTIIAEALGFIPMEGVHHIVEGSHLVDMDTLRNMQMCRHIGGGQYRLLDDEGHVIEPENEEAEDGEPQEEEHIPAPEEPVDMQGFEEHVPPPPQHDLDMLTIIGRFDQLDARLTHAEHYQRESFDQFDARLSRTEDFQRQMMASLQRIEDKLDHLK